ncbi:5-hydroxyisourate hydrolase-like protein (transthyretin family) [Granulicella aggregans]|uniref:5-hydroxyisourate hydrolase-like protein (Transthyretin family) n=1 Tax=Granulicella aggregans TaxID=474949 RepID=A0A7W8E3B9_9BACT|nr:carboxypeptidase regulatory-like domain-containing protein [Granulicella aggregans]MBB5057813.1 5-hydroxyisourate hydrolase-like protein (transthyretin family) [Granulicella aggregans]
MSFFKTSATLCLLSLAALSASAQSSIKGTVTNKTTGKPAAGDDVVLIRLQQGMQESTRGKTDGKGRFSLAVPDPGGVHLVRVTHDKANYFQPVQPGTDTIDVEVFTAAAKVEGITGEADVMRLQTDPSGASLTVVENFFVKNDSTPPKTQFSDHPFDFYLPAGAVIEGSAALGPGGMPVRSAPVPVGDPNHYTFIFPIRPGETRFQVSYKLPYKGSLSFMPKPGMVTDTIAVMMPKSMTFKADGSAPYSSVTEETTAQTYVARNVSPSQPLGFTVSGTGQLPREDNSPQGEATAANGAQSGGPVTSANDTKPGIGLNNPIDPEGNNDPWAKYKWWIIGGLGLVLAAGAGIMLKQPTPQPAAGPDARPAVIPVAASDVSYVAPSASGGVLSALKEELFALETDRLQGTVSDSEYAEQKAALEVLMRRALTRS